MSKTESILRDIYGKNVDIVPSSVWDNGEFIVDGKRVSVDVRHENTYYEAFYKYYDYVDVDEYRISWERSTEHENLTD